MTSARGLLSIAVLLSAIRDSTETATEDYKSGVAQAASLRYTSRHVRAALRGRPSCQAQVRHLHKEGRPRSNHARINDLIIMKKPLACFAALRSFASFALTDLSFLERIPFSQSSQRTAKLAALGWFLRRAAPTDSPYAPSKHCLHRIARESFLQRASNRITQFRKQLIWPRVSREVVPNRIIRAVPLYDEGFLAAFYVVGQSAVSEAVSFDLPVVIKHARYSAGVQRPETAKIGKHRYGSADLNRCVRPAEPQPSNVEH